MGIARKPGDPNPGAADASEVSVVHPRMVRPHITHVSGDFPDPFVPDKTPVIRSLVELTREDFAHHVISLNRAPMRPRDWVPGRQAAPERQAFPYGEALRYRAPARGILHHTMLLRLGDQLAELLADTPPLLLLGHKLTIEGIAVARAAQRLAIPYGISIQGNTDTRILRARPDLRGAFARIYHAAAIALPFTPWARDAVEQRLGQRSGPVTLLPCATDLDEPLAPMVPGEGFVSVFHLRHRRNKNLAGLLAAHRLLRTSHSDARLTIIGGGSDEDAAACRALNADAPGVVFTGALDRAALRHHLNRATGFILPSFRESFGLVFIEALFAGLPVIHPRDAAIDGYFAGYPFVIAVDPRDPHAMAAAMQRVQQQEDALKAALHEWQHSDHARQFTRPAIAAAFRQALADALASG